MIPFRVLVERHEHARPRLLDDEESFLPRPGGLTFFIDNIGFHTREWKRRGACFQWDETKARARRDHDPTGLRLPPSIDDGAATLPYNVRVPLPGRGINWLADRPQQTQAIEVMTAWEMVSIAHQRADRRR